MTTQTGIAITRAIAAIRDAQEQADAADSPALRAGTPCEWTVCPVTLSCLALIRPATLNAVISTTGDWRRESTSFGFDLGHRHPDVQGVWRGIGAVTLRAWNKGHLVTDIYLRRPDGTFLRHADRLFEGLDELPETLVTALHGRPVATYVAHPLFAGIDFTHADAQGRPLTPPSTIPVDGGLKRRVDDRRLAMLRAYRS